MAQMPATQQDEADNRGRGRWFRACDPGTIGFS